MSVNDDASQGDTGAGDNDTTTDDGRTTDTNQDDTGTMGEDNTSSGDDSGDNGGDQDDDTGDDTGGDQDGDQEGDQDQEDDGSKVPDSAEGYKFVQPEGLKNKVDVETLHSFNEFAKEENFTQQQYQKALEFSIKRDERMVEMYEKTLEEGRDSLKKEMGDKLKPGLESARKVIRASGQEAPKDDNDIMDNPQLFKFLIWASEKIQVDDLGDGAGHGAGGSGNRSAADVLHGDRFKD